MIPTSTSNSQNYNRFSYVLNNPLKYVDPSGYVALNPWYEYQAGPHTKFYTWMPEFYEEYLDNQGRKWGYHGETINTPGFYGDETGMWISKLNEHNELIYNYNELRQIVQNNANSNSFFSSFSMGAGTFRVEGEESHNLQLRYEIIPSSTSEFDGFGGKLKYCLNGGNVNGWKYDISGKFEGAAPIGGIAPVPSFRNVKIIQYGGHTLNKSTLNILQITKEEGKRAIEAMKKGNQLPPDFHGNIGKDGSFWSKTGEYIDNILDYIK